MQVEVRKNVFIFADLSVDPVNNPNGGKDFSRTINIPFIPDEVIARNIAYTNDGTESGVSYVWTNLVDDNYLGSVMDGASISPQQIFTLNKPISGNYQFKILGVDGDFDETAEGDLFISLEFVKYKK